LNILVNHLTPTFWQALIASAGMASIPVALLYGLLLITSVTSCSSIDDSACFSNVGLNDGEGSSGVLGFSSSLKYSSHGAFILVSLKMGVPSVSFINKNIKAIEISLQCVT
jgi:hypothetical protein